MGIEWGNIWEYDGMYDLTTGNQSWAIGPPGTFYDEKA
jgi:hypothetical protein